MKAHLKRKVKELLNKIRVKNEASTTGTAPVASGPVAVGGDAARTPFAFSKRGPGNIRAATQLGFKLVKPIKRSNKYKLENQMYSEPAYTTPAFNIEPVDTYIDQRGLVQHNDPELDPNLVGYKQGSLPFTEGFNGLKYEQQDQQPALQSQPQPQQTTVPQQKQTGQPSVDVKSYDVMPDFTAFDTKLKNSTESLKTNLQKTIQDKILGKKIVVRASKGYKQPETDYTINVTGVAIDYYYDRYVIIIVGREENKQKVAKFFIKPGFSIKILGSAELKPKDQYQVAKSKALVEPQQSVVPTNTITSDEDEENTSEPDANKSKTTPTPQQPSTQPQV